MWMCAYRCFPTSLRVMLVVRAWECPLVIRGNKSLQISVFRFIYLWLQVYQSTFSPVVQMCVCVCVCKRHSVRTNWAPLAEYIISIKYAIYFSILFTVTYIHGPSLWHAAQCGMTRCVHVWIHKRVTVCAFVCVRMGLCEGEIMRSCSVEAWSWSPEALDSFQWQTSEQSEYETEHLWQAWHQRDFKPMKVQDDSLWYL